MRTRPFASLLGFVVSLAATLALGACEDHMSPAEAPPPSLATMPRVQQAATSPVAAPESTAATEVIDAGEPSDDAQHAVLVTSCALDKIGCVRAQPSPVPDDTSYRIVFGGGAGAIRTRGQTMADLYKEIRDRTNAGAHLAAQTHHLGDPAPGADLASAPRARSRVDDDPLVEAAFQLMNAVDRDGEITIDTLPPRGPRACKLSLGALDPDGGGANCLVNGSTITPVIPAVRSR